MKTSKKGISLIVLVITIIVMIILATAIILALNSSNISGKANEAKTSSDLANKKEAASVYLSQYEINVAKGKIDKNATSANDYVKAEMKKAGLSTDDIFVTAEGKILAGAAAIFTNKDIPIGTEVKGYKLNNTKTYATSGKENTYYSKYKETDPQPATITRDENITWKYMGVDENGNALIVGSVTDNSPIMILGGKGGYLYGPQELNNACEAMYSSSMGLARSINIDDVTRVLEYTGERGSYWGPNTDEYTPTPNKIKTIDEIIKETGYEMDGNETPEEGKDIGSYKSDYYQIHKTEDASEYNSTNPNAVNLIFTGTTSTNPTLTKWYLLCSQSVWGYFGYDDVCFGVRCVAEDSVYSQHVFFSFESRSAYCDSFAIRPVVSLNSSVQMSYDGTTVTLK